MKDDPQSKAVVGEIVGSRFTSGSLLEHSDSGDTSKPIRVVWDKGQAWRLRLLKHENESWKLPGDDLLVNRDTLRRSAEAANATIVVGGPSSGLSSLYQWLSRAAVGSLPVELVEAQFRGESPEERLRAIALELARSLRLHVNNRANFEIDELWTDLSNDPIDIIREIASRRETLGLDALVFRGFDVLDRETAVRFFGRMRALFEDPRQPLGSLGIVLLGQSIEALDLEHDERASPLLSVSDIYTPTPLFREEAEEMLAKTDSKAFPGDLDLLLQWTGGDPLLIQSLLLLLAPPPKGEGRCRTLQQAIDLIQRNRPPSLANWLRPLREKLKEPEIRQIVSSLLRNGSYREMPYSRRAPIIVLYVDGWIQFDPGMEQWVWKSECRRMLAKEAFAQRSRG